MEEVENVQIESSGDESPEKSSEPSLLASELQTTTGALLVSSPEPSSTLPPAENAPMTQVTIYKFLPAGVSPL